MNSATMQETLVQLLGWDDPWRRDRLPTPVFLVFPSGSAGKESACNDGDLGLIHGGKEAACNERDQCSIPRLGDLLERGTATHSSILAWRIPWTVWSMGSQRVRHN